MENTIKIGFRDTCVNVLFSIINLHGGCLPGGDVCPGGWYLPGGGVCPGGVCQGEVSAHWRVCVSCDLSHHAFDVTCMLSLHQLRLITSVAAYIVFGHVTCDACWDTYPPPPQPWTE